jgi:hypothetical protein
MLERFKKIPRLRGFFSAPDLNKWEKPDSKSPLLARPK